MLPARTKELGGSSWSCRGYEKKTMEGNGKLGGINQKLKAKHESQRAFFAAYKETLISHVYRVVGKKVRIRSRAKYSIKRAEKKVGLPKQVGRL